MKYIGHREIADETDINKLPTDEQIAFDDNKVPDGIKTAVVEEARDDKKICKNNPFVPYPHVKYSIRRTSNLEEEEIKVDVRKVKKVTLDLVHDLLDDIANKTSANDLPENYVDFDTDIDNLPEDDTLPTNYKKSDVINVYNRYRQWLLDNEFVQGFLQAGNAAAIFANDQSNRNRAEEIDISGIEGITASYDGKDDWRPLVITKSQAAEQMITTYGSHNQSNDTNLDALTVDKLELDKVNEILENINKAQKLSDLPSDIDTKYDEGKVPDSKKCDLVKGICASKRVQLNQDAVNKQARITAIQAGFDNLKETAINVEENRLKSLISQAKVQPDITAIEAELNKNPVISASELENSDYKAEMINLVTVDTKRATRKQAIIAEISQIREGKQEKVRQIITQAQNILNKDGATKEEIETAINDLRILINAPADKKLLPEPEKEEPQKGPEIPKEEEVMKDTDVPLPVSDRPLTPQQEAVFVEKELKEHQKACSLKADPEKVKKAETAEKQAIADLMYHEKHECSNELTKPKIAIYFSPNQGGNEHAPLSYAEGVDKNELMLEKVYDEEVSQEQVNPVDKSSDLTPWLIGGSVFLVGGLLLA
ncbi:8406_t:CDS:2 [Ambispora gerdemannii]|uniref:8406_t:CDS:1 n=1 Tax=Ambispora gerdemannii TaxID=144530 RepID=A0A9N9B8Q9_9GLOM|nr:8406_t:CDS:2 [Ambispora gerdemannii]